MWKQERNLAQRGLLIGVPRPSANPDSPGLEKRTRRIGCVHHPAISPARRLHERTHRDAHGIVDGCHRTADARGEGAVAPHRLGRVLHLGSARAGWCRRPGTPRLAPRLPANFPVCNLGDGDGPRGSHTRGNLMARGGSAGRKGRGAGSEASRSEYAQGDCADHGSARWCKLRQLS